ncbi:hypothetical protein Syun_026362 [Stephania yunnanensis]|uniref:Uncharacterized protein n=1 Tax=Stephania yunnanensis TaxID=152371 RepID=A0AAP0EYS4_9MAGN
MERRSAPMEPSWGRDLGSGGVEGRVEFVWSGELKEERRVELICSLGELKEGRVTDLFEHICLNMPTHSLNQKLVRFRSKAVEPIRFWLRVSPLLLAQTGALRFGAFLLLASSSAVDAKQGRRTKKKSRSRWSRSRQEDDQNRETEVN